MPLEFPACKRIAAVAVALVMSPIGNAPAAPVTDEALLNAAIVIGTFDHFAAVCREGRGFDADETGQLESWQSANHVDVIRTMLKELDTDPPRKRQVDTAVATIVAKLPAAAGNACPAAVSVSRTREAQFATATPQLFANAHDESRTAVAAPAPPIAPTRVTVPASAIQLLAEVDSFGFDARLIMGVGGFLTTDIYPVVLFRDGRVLTDVEGLTFPGGTTEHRRTHAGDWTKWRRENGELQIADVKGWRKLPFQNTYRKLPDGLGLDGLFRRLGGAGTLGVGGTSSVTVWNEYRFFPDGRVARGGGSGGRAEAGGTSVTSQGTAANRRGTYRVEGVMLTITYDDGSVEQRILIADPKVPTGAIWLDGAGYAKRRERR